MMYQATTERPLRVAEFETLFTTGPCEQRQLSPTGLPWRLDPTAEAIALDLTARERAYCSFSSFTITPDRDAVSVDVEVPAAPVDVPDALAA
jgi:hypothetical protein